MGSLIPVAKIKGSMGKFYTYKFLKNLGKGLCEKV